MTADPLEIQRLDGGACWRVALGGSKGNILDASLMDALTGVFRDAGQARDLRAIVLEGRGPHFSYGASVPEHLPGRVAEMLARFDGLVRAMLDSAVVTLAAVRGQCLGGGLELAALCHRIVASPDAVFGQPEIVLGVFAPIASTILPERVGRGHAEDLCLSGRSVPAEEAMRMGLVDEIAADPAEAALAYARRFLVPRSASSLRFAARAIRSSLRVKLERDLPALERLYLDELMKTRDAVEGLQAFLEKRQPAWKDS